LVAQLAPILLYLVLAQLATVLYVHLVLLHLILVLLHSPAVLLVLRVLFQLHSVLQLANHAAQVPLAIPWVLLVANLVPRVLLQQVQVLLLVLAAL